MDDKKILFLGDSICRHYFEYAEDYLREHGLSAKTPEKWVTVQWKQARTVDRWFAQKRRYSDLPDHCLCNAKYVHFNFGLHYIKLPSKGHDPDVQRATQEQIDSFEEDLKTHIELIRSYDREVLFTNTTPNPKNAGMRKDEDVVILNEIAKRITEEYEVPHNDIYGFVKSQPDYPKLYMHPRAENNCHFNDEGRSVLGEQIAKFVEENV
jgi:hypothetical protein